MLTLTVAIKVMKILNLCVRYNGGTDGLHVTFLCVLG